MKWSSASPKNRVWRCCVPASCSEAGETDKALSLLHDVEPKTRQDPELRNAVAIAYDSLGQPAAAERVLAFGPQDVQTWGMRASLLAKQGDKAALSNLYNELSRQAAKPDPAQRLLLGKIAEYLKRYPEAVQWYHSVPGGDELSEARLRAANAQALAGRLPQALDEVHAIQSDAVVDDDVRRDAYLLEAELRQRGDDSAGELDALARGLAAYPDDNGLLYARALTWERRDDIPRAEADLRKILVTDPENVAGAERAGLHPGRPYRPPAGGAGADRPRPRGRAGQRRHRRQLWLGAVSPGSQGRGTGAAAPGLDPGQGPGDRRPCR